MFTRETAIRYSWARIGIELLLAVAASSLLVLFYQHVSTEYNKFDAAEISTRDTCKRKHDDCIGASATGCREYNHDECLNATNPLRYTHQQFIKESVFDRHRELWGVDVARFADSQPFVVTAIAACHSKKQDRDLCLSQHDVYIDGCQKHAECLEARNTSAKISALVWSQVEISELNHGTFITAQLVEMVGHSEHKAFLIASGVALFLWLWLLVRAMDAVYAIYCKYASPPTSATPFFYGSPINFTDKKLL